MPLANLFVAMPNAAVPVDKFADSTGAMTDLLTARPAGTEPDQPQRR